MPEPHSRSTEPEDYQDLAQSIGAMAKHFTDGHVIPPHIHARDQLLYAIRGVMRLETDAATWVVPQDRAVFIPGGARHSVRMHGDVEMRTLYIDRAGLDLQHSQPQVVAVSALLRELILALVDEPIDYAPDSRADMIARLIGRELSDAHRLSLDLPLPKDPRLQRLCAAILAAPSDRRPVDAWAGEVGASARTLARLCDKELGMPFSQWRRRARFQSALEAIARGGAIGRIAADHGYRSPSAFSAAFAKAFGAPPTQLAET